MEASRPLWFLALAVLIGSTAGMVSIDPQTPVVRLGQTVRLMCRVAGPIKNCLWEINKELYILSEGQRFQPYGRLQDGECGIQATMSEAENGEWTCRVFLEGAADRAEKATTNVTLLALPQISLRPNADPITVMAGQETEVTCIVADARPVPAIIWMIGEREIDSPNRHSTDVPKRDTGLHTITDTLKYTFEAVDHGHKIRCLTAGTWLNVDDPRDSAAQLNVIFPPQPKEPSTLYGFVAGQAGDVVVNFTANPRPIRVFWKLDDDTELDVIPFDGRSASTDRYEVSQLMEPEHSLFEARLRIRSVSEADARRSFRLLVESDLNGEQQTREYTVWISMNSAPLQSGGVSGGGIVGIIFTVILIIVLVAALLYFRKQGKFCFAGHLRTVGEGESQAHIDEENPGEIVKEKEGKEGPLKGSTEDLNLALATDANVVENGNNGNLPSPVKEQQQQKNGGGLTPTQDGKDTAV